MGSDKHRHRTRKKKREAGERVGQSLTSDSARRVILSPSRYAFLFSPATMRLARLVTSTKRSSLRVMARIDSGSGSAITSALLSHMDTKIIIIIRKITWIVKMFIF